jgi:hypothetical protein
MGAILDIVEYGTMAFVGYGTLMCVRRTNKLIIHGHE